jgi:hypothetical protein
MWKYNIDATEALERVRTGTCCHRIYGLAIILIGCSAREQIWVKPGFQEQLVLFRICQYAPNPEEGIYRTWRTRRDEILAQIEEQLRLQAQQAM